MDASVESLYCAAMKLSPLEREDLATRLFGSLDSDEPVELDPAWDAEIARRVEELRSGEATTVTRAEVMDRLRKIKDA